ncbi:MAG: hypothetical protein ACJASR_001776 [Psychroserpens sp.]|jgi:hypothetical protein
MAIRRLLEVFQNNLILILLSFFYLSEAISKYFIYFSGEKSMLPRTIKFLAMTYLFYVCLKKSKALVQLFLLLVFFLVGQFFLTDGFEKEITVSFFKFIFPLVLFTAFNNQVFGEDTRKRLFVVFEAIFVVNSILIIVGGFFKFYLFETYKDPRFGFNGLFITSATGSYAYLIALYYFLLKYKQDFLRNWKVILVLIASIFMGTKVLYISLIVTTLLYLGFYANFTRAQKKTIAGGILICTLIAVFLLFFKLGNFNDIRQKSGLISSLLSFRDELFLEDTLPYIMKNWSAMNYLFGGISDLTLRSQLGFIDVFFFWGIIGGSLYLFSFYKSYMTFQLKESTIYFLLMLSVLVFLAGNFFENASIAIYLLVLREKLIQA